MPGRRTEITSVEEATKEIYEYVWKSLSSVPAANIPSLAGLSSAIVKSLVAAKWNELFPQQQPKTTKQLSEPLQYLQRWLRLDTTTSEHLESVIQYFGLNGSNLRKMLAKQQGMKKFAEGAAPAQFQNAPAQFQNDPARIPPGGTRSATKCYVAREIKKTLKRCAKLGLITTVDEWNKYEVELNHVAKVHSSMDLPNVLKGALPAFVLTLKLAKKNGWSYEETIDRMDGKKIILKRVKKTAPESLPPMRLFQTPPTSPAAKSLSPEFLTAPDGANESPMID